MTRTDIIQHFDEAIAFVEPFLSSPKTKVIIMNGIQDEHALLEYLLGAKRAFEDSEGKFILDVTDYCHQLAMSVYTATRNGRRAEKAMEGKYEYRVISCDSFATPRYPDKVSILCSVECYLRIFDSADDAMIWKLTNY